jgi:adenine deaminase
MATLNPAEYFRMETAGAVAPGRRADLVVFSDLSRLAAEQVYARGVLTAENGKILPGFPTPPPVPVPAAMHVQADALDFAIPAVGRRARVIEIVPGQIVTRQRIETVARRGGEAVADPGRDILKIAVIERHTGSGRIGRGLVSGFNLQRGALASSVAHDAHNLIVVGVDDTDMRAAAQAVVKMGGGLAAASDGEIRARLPLPLAGLMSDAPLETVRAALDRLSAAARGFGTPLADPFMTLSFLALPVIPALKITDQGLVDVDRFEVVPLFVA